jgi:hypothetical protein
VPPIQPKKPLHPNAVLLLACAVVLLLSGGLFASSRYHRRSEAAVLTPERSRELVSARLHDPLVLPLPNQITVRRRSPDDIAYHALESAGIVTLHRLATRFYRHQRAPYDRLELTLTDAGWAAAADWPRRGDDSFLIPLARPYILAMDLSPGSDPETGSAEYWIRWRWQPTPLGGQLLPHLHGAWSVPRSTYGAHATLQRSDDGWQVTHLAIAR